AFIRDTCMDLKRLQKFSPINLQEILNALKQPTRLMVQVVALAVFLLVHLAGEDARTGTEKASGYQSLFSQAFWYQQSVNIGARRSVNDYVALVIIGLDEPQ